MHNQRFNKSLEPTIRILLIALVSAVWALPLIRAVRLLCYAFSVDDGSINAANDTSFGLSLVVSYVFSFAVALVMVWILASRHVWLLFLPLAGSLLVAMDVIRIAPENVIVILPTMYPFRPAVFSLFIAGVGVLIIWLHQRHEKAKHNAERHSSRL